MPHHTSDTQTSTPNTKICPGCGIEKPLTDYYRGKGKYGRMPRCISCGKESSRQYRLANLDRCRERGKRYYSEHKQENSARAIAWREANKEQWDAYYSEWSRANLSKRRASKNRRRALEAGLPATLTAAEWEDILATYGYQCAYCSKTWADGKLAQEHVIPVTQGGGYVKENIVPACKSCNSRKHDRTPEQVGMTLRQVS